AAVGKRPQQLKRCCIIPTKVSSFRVIEWSGKARLRGQQEGCDTQCREGGCRLHATSIAAYSGPLNEPKGCCLSFRREARRRRSHKARPWGLRGTKGERSAGHRRGSRHSPHRGTSSARRDAATRSQTPASPWSRT